jgi:segregation and condensation protein A
VAEELTFHLEDFDGPLELLLALVAKHNGLA